ncbi:MAG: hypothetical protein ACFFER_02510 [Candidatus Thorarchaeota archaeon]
MKRDGLLTLVILIGAYTIAILCEPLAVPYSDTDNGKDDQEFRNIEDVSTFSDSPGPIFRELGNWTLGGAESVWIEGDIAYSGMGAHLAIFNVTNKSKPVLLSSFWYSDSVEDVCVNNGIAYVASGDAGLSILNVTDPKHVFEIGRHFEDEYAKSLYVQNDFLYLATFSIFRLVNVSDITNPQVLGTNSGHYDGVTNVHADGDIIGICIFESGVRFLNASNPSALTWIGYHRPTGEVVDVHIEGRLAYCLIDAYPANGITVLNITDSNPWIVLVATERLDVWTDNMDFENGFGYVGNRNLGLTIINFTDPTDPEIVFTWDTDEWMMDVQVQGDFCYIADRDNGFRIINVTNSTSPFMKGEYRQIRNPRGFLLEGNLVFLVDMGRGLTILDVTNPKQPAEVGYCIIPFRYGGVDIRIDGTLACILAESGLWTVDISDVANPVVLDGYSLGHGCMAIEMIEDFCFVACGGDFMVFNITDTANITHIDSWTASSGVYDILLSKQSVFLGTSDGLELINITDHTDMSLLWKYNLPMYHTVHSLFTVNSLLYGSTIDVEYFGDEGYLLVFNISSPNTPSYVTSYTLPSGVYHAYYYDEIVLAERSELEAYNLTGSGVESLGSYPAENDHNYWDDYAFARDDLIYLTDVRGFWILDHDFDSDALYTLDELALGTDCRNPDSDFDSMPDGWENSTGLDPLFPDTYGDPDFDDLLNIYEFGNETLPLNNDTDSDLMPDGWEVVNELDPLSDDAYGDPDVDDLVNLHEFRNQTLPHNSDTDSDLMPDGWEVIHSLNATKNDAFEDPDVDLLANLYEYRNGTLPHNNDSDFDLMPDGWEVISGLNATFDDAFEDPDNDDLVNLDEYTNHTLPRNNDTDSDLMPDGWEVFYGLDPLFDDSGEDPDGDSYTNLREYRQGTNPMWYDPPSAVSWSTTTTSTTSRPTIPSTSTVPDALIIIGILAGVGVAVVLVVIIVFKRR